MAGQERFLAKVVHTGEPQLPLTSMIIQRGLVTEVIANEPYTTWEGAVLSQHPTLQFGLGNTYRSCGTLPRIFIVVSPGIEYESPFGDRTVEYSAEFIENDSRRTGTVVVDQSNGYVREKLIGANKPLGVPNVIEVGIGPCERFTEPSAE